MSLQKVQKKIEQALGADLEAKTKTEIRNEWTDLLYEYSSALGETLEGAQRVIDYQDARMLRNLKEYMFNMRCYKKKIARLQSLRRS